MRPNDTPVPTSDPRGPIALPDRDHNSQHTAVANMTRDQISEIYSKQAQSDHETTIQTQSQDSSVYDRTHENAHEIQKDQWQKYHSSWQNYYQQYYERYYMGAVQQAHSVYQKHYKDLKQMSESGHREGEPISQEEATKEIRSQLLQKVSDRAKAVRKSRHFFPLVAAISVAIAFIFVQYNSVIVAYAQNFVSPGNIDSQNIIVDPNAPTSVDQAPRLIIPKINVDISVDYSAGVDYDSQMAAMKNSVAYFGIAGANSKPGQLGNVPIAGHSSNDFTEAGDAKFVFARLEQLQKNDTFYLNYEGTRYTYVITGTKVVPPSGVSALQVGADKPYATLITCTPLGTAKDRLLVFAEQVSPSPSTAKAAGEQTASNSSKAEFAGKSPTLFERAFGG